MSTFLLPSKLGELKPMEKEVDAFILYLLCFFKKQKSHV